MTPRECQAGERIADREEYRAMKVTRIPAEDPDTVRARDGATLEGIDGGVDPLAYLGEPE